MFHVILILTFTELDEQADLVSITEMCDKIVQSKKGFFKTFQSIFTLLILITSNGATPVRIIDPDPIWAY